MEPQNELIEELEDDLIESLFKKHPNAMKKFGPQDMMMCCLPGNM